MSCKYTRYVGRFSKITERINRGTSLFHSFLLTTLKRSVGILFKRNHRMRMRRERDATSRSFRQRERSVLNAYRKACRRFFAWWTSNPLSEVGKNDENDFRPNSFESLLFDVSKELWHRDLSVALFITLAPANEDVLSRKFDKKASATLCEWVSRPIWIHTCVLSLSKGISIYTYIYLFSWNKQFSIMKQF